MKKLSKLLFTAVFCLLSQAAFAQVPDYSTVNNNKTTERNNAKWYTIKNVKTGELTTYEADPDDGLFGLFGFIGMIPNSGLFEGIIDMERGYIKTDDNMHTNIPGVYAAGDIRVKSLRQVVTAAADGAIAAMQAEKYLAEME